MRLTLLPKTKTGIFSIIFIVSFFMFSILVFILITLGQRGGPTFFSNLILAIPGLLAAISGIISFIIGIIDIFKNKDYSTALILATFIGLLVTLFVLGEILFPH